MKPKKPTDRAKIRLLKKENRELQRQIDSLTRQVNQASQATNDMAHHCRALEIQAAAHNIQDQGLSVFGSKKTPNLAMGLEVPALAPASRTLVDSKSLATK